MNKLENLRKLYRFSQIYGWQRSFNKAAGRMRYSWIRRLYLRKNHRSISVIGNGQFAFSTICFFVAKKYGNIFLTCFDTEPSNAESLKNYYGFKKVASTAQELLEDNNLLTLYIASNHASHTSYAVEAMKSGVKSIHIEKPISTTYNQLVTLIKAQLKYSVELWAGYNRPYSRAIVTLKERIVDIIKYDSVYSINYFISGHKIPNDHWYREKEEGTRICGNMGHWLDLTIHLFALRKMPDRIDISINYSNLDEADDNIVVNMVSDLGDLVSIMLSSRTEPYEGINETINIQIEDVIAKIDDFRNLTIWQAREKEEEKYFPKDVGHNRAVLQPFYSKKDNRNWGEVVTSTLLMLHIKNMVLSQVKNSVYHITDSETNFYKATQDSIIE